MRIFATASSVALRIMVLWLSVSCSPPPTATGVAAPRLVVGAMAATWAAYTTNTPAEAARAPGGATYTITGTGEPRIALVMSSVDFNRPPGVSSSTTRATAPAAWASRIPRLMYMAEAGEITPSTRIRYTTGPCGAAKPRPDPRTRSSRRISR
ncbi:hypothetical protein HRbin31_00421 [bacterium HR31]|nr:hypothetical protein HRbin31_00421 [bacterium HR31]